MTGTITGWRKMALAMRWLKLRGAYLLDVELSQGQTSEDRAAADPRLSHAAGALQTPISEKALQSWLGHSRGRKTNYTLLREFKAEQEIAEAALDQRDVWYTDSLAHFTSSALERTTKGQPVVNPLFFENQVLSHALMQTLDGRILDLSDGQEADVPQHRFALERTVDARAYAVSKYLLSDVVLFSVELVPRIKDDTPLDRHGEVLPLGMLTIAQTGEGVNAGAIPLADPSHPAVAKVLREVQSVGRFNAHLSGLIGHLRSLHDSRPKEVFAGNQTQAGLIYAGH